MKLTPGKLAGLQRVSDKRGVIAAAAMDQRGSLQKALAKEKGGEIGDSMMEEFKSLVTEVLTPHATAILLDPEWGLPAAKRRARNSGLLLAYFTYAPDSPTQTGSVTSPLTILGLLLFVIGEAGNLNSHLVLRDLRREGTTERGIPRGIGFGLVTCPNYMFETIAWLGIWAVNRSWSTVVFLVLAVAQMASWAWKKEKRYRKEFPETYKKKRYAMLPGIV